MDLQRLSFFYDSHFFSLKGLPIKRKLIRAKNFIGLILNSKSLSAVWALAAFLCFIL